MPKYPDVHVKLVGEDGNAYAIMGRVSQALENADVPAEKIKEYRTESMSGDYNHLLITAMEWVSCDDEDEDDEDDWEGGY